MQVVVFRFEIMIDRSYKGKRHNALFVMLNLCNKIV